jgi:hypothetical protein
LCGEQGDGLKEGRKEELQKEAFDGVVLKEDLRVVVAELSL